MPSMFQLTAEGDQGGRGQPTYPIQKLFWDAENVLNQDAIASLAVDRLLSRLLFLLFKHVYTSISECPLAMILCTSSGGLEFD